MASAPRDFVANEPVLVTTRCVLRVPFLSRPAMKTELRRLVARWAPVCGVEVLAFTFAANHIHVLLCQDHSGIDKARRRGIAWFLRNVLSGIALYGNGLHSSQGHFVERRYWSRRRASPEQALQSLGYILEHPIKHGIVGGADEEYTSGRVYRRGTPDGVCTAVLGLFVARDPEVRWAAIVNLIEEMHADPRWREEGVEVAREAMTRHPEVVDKRAWQTPMRVALWAGEEAARRALEAVLSAPQERVEFSPRKAPRLGGVVTVVFREAPGPQAGTRPGPPPPDSS